jgi:hypothetical protein
MPESKYKLLDSTIHILPPGEEAFIARPVRLIFDRENDTLGAMFIGEGNLRGYCVFIPRDALARVIIDGKEVEKLEVPK